MTEHRIRDIAGNEWGVGDHVFWSRREYNSHGLAYGLVREIQATWVPKMDGGYWDYVVFVIPLTTSQGAPPRVKSVRLVNVEKIGKAASPVETHYALWS